METRKCITCKLYKKDVGQCENGWVNPGSKYDTRRIMKVKGVRRICKYSEHKIEVAKDLGLYDDLLDDEKAGDIC